MNKYRRTKTTVSFINYHFAFCPRYRRKVFLHKGVEDRFKQLVHEMCEELEIGIVALECDEDHTYMFLNAMSSLSSTRMKAKIKEVTSRKLRAEFPHLQHLPNLWTRSYFVSTTGNVPSTSIKNYVEQQKKRG